MCIASFIWILPSAVLLYSLAVMMLLVDGELELELRLVQPRQLHVVQPRGHAELLAELLRVQPLVNFAQEVAKVPRRDGVD